jgi:hypothetical protein
MIKKYIDPLSKGRMQKNPTKNNHFLHETGDKKSVAKVYEAFFGQFTCIFLFLLNFFSQGP